MPDDLTPEDQAWLDLLETQVREKQARGLASQPFLAQEAPGVTSLLDAPAQPPPAGLGDDYRSLIPLPFDALHTFKEEKVAPAAEWLRENVGHQLGMLVHPSPFGEAGNEARKGTSRYANMTPRMQTASSISEGLLGTVLLGNVLPLGAPGILPQLGRSALAGAAGQGAMALTQPGVRTENAALEGAATGMLFKLTGMGLKAGFRAGAKLLGSIKAPEMEQLARESTVLPETPEPPRRPTYVMLQETDAGPAAKVVGLEQGGKVKTKTFLLQSTEDVAKVKALAKDAPVILHPGFDPSRAQGLAVPKDWDTPTGQWMDHDLVRGKDGALKLEQRIADMFEPGAKVQVTKANGKVVPGTVGNKLPNGTYEVLTDLPKLKPENLKSSAQAPYAWKQAMAERINQPTPPPLKANAHQMVPYNPMGVGAPPASQLPEAVGRTPSPVPMEGTRNSAVNQIQVMGNAPRAVRGPDQAPAFQGVPLGEPTPVDPVTMPQIGRDPRSGAIGPPGGGSGKPSPTSPAAFENGDLVYLDEASPRRTTAYTTVKVLGPAPEGKVRVQVTADQGEPLIKDVLPERLTHARTVPPVTGPAPKAPMPVPLPGTLAPETVEEFRRTMDIVNYANRNPGVAAKVKNFLMAPGLRPGEAPEFARLANSLRGARRVTETMQDNLRAFRAAAGPQFRPEGEFDRAVNAVLDGKAPLSSLERFGEGWQRVKDQVRPMLDEDAYLHDKLVKMGYVKEGSNGARAIMGGDADLYAARMYYSKMLKPGEWAKRAPQKVLIEGQDFLRRQAEKRGVFMTDAEVADEVNKFLNARDINGNPVDAFEAFKASSLGQPFKHLKRLQDLPEPLRNLMGEVHSGIYRLATSLGIQRGLVAQLTLMEEIAANPQWASIGPQPGWVKIPALPAYGKAGGMFVSPEVAEAVINLPDTLSRGQAILQSLIGLQKANIIIASPRAHVRQHIQSMLSGVLAGGVDPTRPVQSLTNMQYAARVMDAYHKNPSGSGLAELMQEAKALGAVDVGFGSAEIKSAERKMLEAVSEAIQSPGTKNLWGLLPKLRSISEKFYDRAGRAYESSDQFFRLASYLSQRDNLMRAGMPLKVAREEAARRVAMSFVSPGNVSDAVNKLRRGMGGVVNPYLTPIVEEARIAATLPERFKTEPDLKWRLGAFGMIVGTGYGSFRALQHFNGISDEEVAAARAIQPQGQQAFRTAQLPLAWRDEKGRVQFMDLSWMHTGLQLMRGDPSDAMWRRVLANTLYLPVSGGGLEGETRRFIESTGLVTPAPQPPELREGEAGLMEMMQRLNAIGLFGPTVIGEAARTGQQAGLWGYQSPYREQLTPGQAASKVLGVPIAPVTVPKTPTERSPSYEASTREDIFRMLNLYGQNRSGAATDESRAAVDKKVDEIDKRMIRRWLTVETYQKKRQQGGAK